MADRPMTLDDLLILLPGLRRLRGLTAEWLRILLDRRAGECTWCGFVTPRGRGQWCGDNCVNAFQSRCDANTQRAIVERRDAGVCRACGRDTRRAEQDYLTEVRFMELPADPEMREAILGPIRARHGFARGRWREVHHTTPVSEGGGLCDPSEMQTVCGVCHANSTATLARRLPARR